MDLRKLHEDEARRAYAFALRLLGDSAAAEDAVAEAFALLAEGRAEAAEQLELARAARAAIYSPSPRRER